MPEQTCDSTPPQGRRSRLTTPGSGLALCGLGIRPTGSRPFPRAAGLCSPGPESRPDESTPDSGTTTDSNDTE